MDAKPEAQAIAIELASLRRRARAAKLQMLGNLLNLASIEARAQAGEYLHQTGRASAPWWLQTVRRMRMSWQLRNN